MAVWVYSSRGSRSSSRSSKNNQQVDRSWQQQRRRQPEGRRNNASMREKTPKPAHSLVPADEHADVGKPRLEHLEPRVSWVEVKLLLVCGWVLKEE